MRHVLRHIVIIIIGCSFLNANAQDSHQQRTVKHVQAVDSHKRVSVANKSNVKKTVAKPVNQSALKKTTHPNKKEVNKKVINKNTKKATKKIAVLAPRRVSIPNDRTAIIDPSLPAKTAASFNESRFPHFFSSIESRLVSFVHKTVSTLRYSSYKLGGRNFDLSNGVYVLDCSDYVDHILEEIYPNAYSSLMDSTGSDKPTSAHYYSFFNRLSPNSHNEWRKIKDVEELRAGDILVFRNHSTGHVMVVMDKPTYDEDAYFVKVADSAPSGHSQDTRPNKVSGIGIGTLLLKANPNTGEPLAYAWKIGARWKNNMKIAMARPAAG